MYKTALVTFLGISLILWLGPQTVQEIESVPSLSKSDYITITAEEAYELINNTPTLFIIDVRTSEEYNQGYIKNAVSIPLSELESRADELPLDLQTPLLVYCQSGYRSVQASQQLTSMNYSQVHNLDGGFSAWKAVGYPYVTQSTQVQTTQTTNASLPVLMPITVLVLLSLKRLDKIG